VDDSAHSVVLLAVWLLVDSSRVRVPWLRCADGVHRDLVSARRFHQSNSAPESVYSGPRDEL